MAFALKPFNDEQEVLLLEEIHRSASQHAEIKYKEEYGIAYHGDSLWVIGNDRWEFWLRAFERRQASLIINPYQD